MAASLAAITLILQKLETVAVEPAPNQTPPPGRAVPPVSPRHRAALSLIHAYKHIAL